MCAQSSQRLEWANLFRQAGSLHFGPWLAQARLSCAARIGAKPQPAARQH